MKKLIYLLFIIGITACSQENKNQALISGKINFPQEGKPIYLVKIEGQNAKVIDSAFANSEGSFAFNLSLQEPDFYVIDIYRMQNKLLLLHDTPIKITADGTQNGKFEVSGSEDNQYLQEFMTLREAYVQEVGELQKSFYGREISDEEEAQLQAKYEEITNEATAKTKAILEKAQHSFAAMQMFSLLDVENDLDLIDKIHANLAKKYPTSEQIKQLGKELEGIKKTAIGQPAPEIRFQNQEGKEVSLANFRGKYLLLDFWASWCRPCRMENPNVVRVYNKYKDKGFEILSISSDRDEQAWKSAITADKMTWNHIPDLSANHTISMDYNVTAIPMTYLLDKNGIIIAKNLRGKALEEKIVELLQM